MSTAEEARRLADAIQSCLEDWPENTHFAPAAAMLRAQADQIERLQAGRDSLRAALFRLKRLNETGLYRDEIVFEGSGRYAVDIDTVNEIGEVIDAALAAKETSNG